MVESTRSSPSWATRMEGAFEGNERPEHWHVWVALNARVVFERIEPSRLDEAKRAHAALFDKLAPYEQEALRNTERSLKERSGKTHVAEFLAMDTRSFFSSRSLPDEDEHDRRRAQRRPQEATGRTSIRLGRARHHPRHARTQRGIQSLPGDDLSPDPGDGRGAAKAPVGYRAAPSRTLRDVRPGSPTRAPPPPDASRLYFAVLHCAASRALMALGREKEALTRLNTIMQWVGQDGMQPLDVVDLVDKEVLQAIELAPTYPESRAAQSADAAPARSGTAQHRHQPRAPWKGIRDALSGPTRSFR